MTESGDDFVLTTGMACEYLRVSRPTFFSLFWTGELTPLLINGQTFVRLAEVDALLDRNVTRYWTREMGLPARNQRKLPGESSLCSE